MWRMRRGSNSRAELAPDSTVFEAGPLVHSGTHPSFLEEKRGFGPLCRIPATTAFPMRAIRPLWHFSAMIGGRREVRTRDRGGTSIPGFKPGAIGRSASLPVDVGTESRNRICDARAFNATLYRLSYLGKVNGAPRGSRIPGFLLDREALWPLSYRS